MPWDVQWVNVINLSASVVTLFALFLAFLQMREARSQTRALETMQDEARTQAQALETIQDEARSQAQALNDVQKAAEKHTEAIRVVQESLSTRFLSHFPHFMKDITELLRRAQDSVYVVADFPAYGCFSNYAGYVEYKGAIESLLVRTESAKLVFLGMTRERTHYEQFSKDDEAWLLRKRRDRPKFEEFVKRERLTTVDDLTHNEFWRILAGYHQNMLDQLRGADVALLDEDVNLSLHFWVIDSREAIVSIPCYAEAATEYGFFTSDPRLIQALEAIANRLYRQGRKLHERPAKVGPLEISPVTAEDAAVPPPAAEAPDTSGPGSGEAHRVTGAGRDDD